MRGSSGKRNKTVERTLLAALGVTGLPFTGCFLVAVLFIAIVVGAAGGILGWLFGGGAPSGTGNAGQAPAAEVHFWTPTPVPSDCFVTPVPVAITVPPATPGDPPGTAYLPTPTPCPRPKNNWDTPDPRWTPVPPGYGPHGSPFHSNYVVTQPFGCTDFPEFRDQACALATGGSAPWFHRGYDMVSTGNKTVYATLAGRCIFAGFASDGFGIRAYVQAGQFLAIYPHLSRVYLAAGQNVEWGQPVGEEGSTGYSTGEHLHYEIHINGAWVDPVPYLNRS
ncbi:MAG TPA: peptidoglycan DD-metalloendopeptidase family protein [Chloroflexia bacterium]|nr:peptidoglycan DD-metalloendopeptidase family protein [Chloroflexia bacterium]